ncbi:unnamed protein product [Rotaria sp. Silwood1]|nr:unnamed protein product [Rotaria sp. Silwood1]CAF1628541.1 unnamed protein product [Rotaria sp. Silwood1]
MMTINVHSHGFLKYVMHHLFAEGKYLSDTEHIDHSLSVNNLTLLCLISIECSGDNIVPQSTMAINKFTRIDEIFCSYFPHMADTCLQSEVD